MSNISFHSPRVRIDLDLLNKIETEHGGGGMKTLTSDEVKIIDLMQRIAALEAIIQYHPGGDCMNYTELAEEYGKLIKVAEAGIAIWEATPEEVDRYLKEQGE